MIISLQIAIVLCADALQGLRLFLGCPSHCPALNTLRGSPKGLALPLMEPVIFAQNAEPNWCALLKNIQNILTSPFAVLTNHKTLNPRLRFTRMPGSHGLKHKGNEQILNHPCTNSGRYISHHNGCGEYSLTEPRLGISCPEFIWPGCSQQTS